MSLAQRVNMFMSEAVNLASPYKELQPLKKELEELKARLNKPLRVAVVGVIKAGKSTLMNALMGERVVVTGNVETTYTPGWFRYGSTEGITVTLDNGRIVEGSIEDIPFWTVRGKANPDLDRVEYVEIKRSNPMLKEIELIDTPGLESTYCKDSDNAMKFVGLGRNDMNQITLAEASMADAIVYAFSRGMGEKDENILKAFQGPLLAGASPINAIGVLTKVDSYWSDEYQDPMEGGKKIVTNLKNNIKVKSLLYTVFPVIGKLAESRNSLGEKEISILKALSTVEPDRMRKLIMNGQRFCEKEYDDIPISAQQRNYIWESLGQYGVHLALTALRDGEKAENLGGYLYERSGVKELVAIIKQHFGNRAYLIKLNRVISTMRNKCFAIMNTEGRKNPCLNSALECILSGCEKLEAEEHAFAELRVLQNYYNESLKFYSEKEIEEFLQITGEYGSNCEARLGAEEGTPVRKLAVIAREKAREWNLKANDGMNTQTYEEAARVMARSCEIMHYHLSYLTGYK